MGKLVVVSATTVDGMYEGPGKDVEAMPMDRAFPEYNLERIKAADAVLVGAKSYELFKGYWPDQETNPDATDTDREFARLYRPIKKVVVSNHAEPPETGHPWAGTVEIVKRSEAHDAVLGLKRTTPADREIVTWGSRTLWTALIGQRLVDELHLIVGAAALGSGTRTFDGLAAKFDRLEVRAFPNSQSALLRYAVEHTA